MPKKYVAKPLPPFKYKVPGVKNKALYGDLVGAFYAGSIKDFGFQTISDDDPKSYWVVDGAVFDAKDFDGVKAAIKKALSADGIKSVDVGPTWCGYPTTTITYYSGVTIVKSYDGSKVVVDTNWKKAAA